MSKRPNILIFNPDEMRWDCMRHLGNPAACTPNLDAMLDDSVSFSNAFVQNPVCTPSRCSFMSGLYPHVHGHRTMSYMIHPGEPILLNELRDAGYYVWTNERGDLIPGEGVNPYRNYADEIAEVEQPLDRAKVSAPRGDSKGDNYYSFYHGIIEAPGGKDDVFDMDASWVQSAVEFIRRRPKDKPFCMFLPLMYPHVPYQVAKKYYDMIDDSKILPPLPAPEDWEKAGKPSILKGIHDHLNMDGWTEDRWVELRKVYLAMCTRVDAQFGELMQALKEEGIYDDTAVFVFSDHGDFAGDYGLVEKTQNTFEDCLVRVPFIVKPPKETPVRPGVNPALVELVDFYATAMEMAGVEPTHTHFGKSLLPLLSGEVKEQRDFVCSEGGRLKSERHCSESLNMPSYLSPENDYYPRMLMQFSQGPEHTKATMLRTHDFKYVRRLDEKDELYDLRKDPHEQHNIIDDPAMAETVQQMREQMLEWYQETCDTVPFKEDKRMCDNVMLSMLRGKIPQEQYDKMKAALSEGLDFEEFRRMARK